MSLLRSWAARWVERRLGGYVHSYAEGDPSLPERLETPRRVAVVGGGLAGISAAWHLGRRGFEVVLLEANPYLGGKLGAWREAASDGTEVLVEHGFHAFFPHYHNLNRFLREQGFDEHLVQIEDYWILGADGRANSFKHADTVPLLNLISLGRLGVFSWREILGSRAIDELDVFLRYDEEQTFADLDGISFAEFAERAQIPASLMLSFNSFSRAFFSEPDRLSTAELVKSFHFYYLGQDGGLLYRFPDDDYERAVIGPLRDRLEAAGVEIRLGAPVTAIGEGLEVAGERFDAVVIASSVPGTRELVAASAWLGEADPELVERVEHLRTGQRYAVLRLWLDRDLDEDTPPYFVVERVHVLDAVARLERMQRSVREACERDGGAVIELHSYALPDGLPDDEVAAALRADLRRYLPSFADVEVVREHLQIRQDFPAFHTGQHAWRPGPTTAVEGLYLAGDWVRLPFPAMLMEAAWTSGLLVANAELARNGLRLEPVEGVPRRGVLYGLPRPPRLYREVP